ncbi:MAG TPA: hypothetical protein DD670_16050 [Planctomycetaceae bacterium]|nr:hypothetical protein [Planctomycetaceae bacterium]
MKCRACVLGLSFVVAVCIAESASAYYNPSLGRFVSRDPIGYEGSPGNLYEYVGGRPNQLTDALGLKKGDGAPFDPEQSLDQILDRYSDNFFVEEARFCPLNIYFADQCGGFDGLTFISDSYIHVCLNKNEIKNEQTLAALLLHELVHVRQFCSALGERCPRRHHPPFTGTDPVAKPPTVDDSWTDDQKKEMCDECKRREGTAYSVSCSVVHKKYSDAWRKCQEVGKCVSCKWVCKEYQQSGCDEFPEATVPWEPLARLEKN